MRITNLTLVVSLVCAACSTDSPAPVALSQSQQFLTSPPPIDCHEAIGIWGYKYRFDDPDIEFVSSLDTLDQETLTTPDAGVLSTFKRTQGGVEYLLVSTVTTDDKFTLYRYHDADSDGVPDASTKVMLLDSGTAEMYVTSMAIPEDGKMYLFDARCRDIQFATDSDSDGWADTLATTPYAKSDNFDEFEHIQAIHAVDVGEVLGLVSFGTQDYILSLGTMGGYHFDDADDDDVADDVTMPYFEDGHVTTKGAPYDGQSSIQVRGPEGTTAQVWLLDAKDEETTLLGSVAVADSHAWTSLTLSSALDEDDRISIRRSDDSDGATRLTVMDDRPQLVDIDPFITDVTGGTYNLEGLNLASGMSATLITADGSDYTVSLTYVDSTTATATITAMADDQAGSAYLYVWASTTPPTEPADTAIRVFFLPEPDSSN